MSLGAYQEGQGITQHPHRFERKANALIPHAQPRAMIDIQFCTVLIPGSGLAAPLTRVLNGAAACIHPDPHVHLTER